MNTYEKSQILSSDKLHIRAGAFEGFRSLVSEYGIEPHIILEKAGLDELTLKFPETQIPTDKYRRALNLAAKYTGEPHFGLLMSQRQSLHKFGAIGYLMLHASTVGQSISCLDRYLRIHDAGSKAHISIQDKTALWTDSLQMMGQDSVTQHTELSLGLAVKIIRIIHSETWHPDAVYFEHAKPSNAQIFEKIFKCPIYFEQSANALEFPERLLQEKLPSSDQGLYQIIHAHIEGLAKRKNNTLVSRAKQSICDSLEHGKPSLKQTARDFGLHPAQFQRRLKQEGTTFQHLLQDVRTGLACKYLSESDMPLATIATLLAYAEPAVFSRSFKRHIGMTPRDWRQKNTTTT